MQVDRDRVEWNWQGQRIRVGVSRSGAGPVLLMLPALSSISTRREMTPLARQLRSDFTTVAIDWPGFGSAPRPAVDWRPEAYRAFLAEVLAAEHPFATIAAGHAAGYLLALAREHPGAAGPLCLVAPTWRGPAPTMIGKRHSAFTRLARAVDLPVIGQALYRLNVNPFMVKKMALGHVYVEPGALSRAVLEEKLAVTRAVGARHASIRFVLGELDPMRSHEEFLDVARAVIDRILVVYGADTPSRSKAEMEALTTLPNVRAMLLPAGKLAVHEEFADATAAALRPFLGITRPG